MPVERRRLRPAFIVLLVALALPAQGAGREAQSDDVWRLRQSLLLGFAGRLEAAEKPVVETLRRQEARGDVRGQAESTWILAMIRSRRGKSQEAIQLYGRSADLARRADDPLAAWMALYGKGEMERYRLDHSAAEASYEVSIEEIGRLRRRVEAGEPLRLDAFATLASALGIPKEQLDETASVLPPEWILDQPEILSACGLADVLHQKGEHEAALELLRSAEKKARILGILEARIWRGAGEVALARGELNKASELLEESLERSGQLTDFVLAYLPIPKMLLSQGTLPILRLEEMPTRLSLGRLDRQRFRFDDAERHFQEARDVARSMGDADTTAVIDLELAALDARRADPTAVRRRLEAVVELAEEHDLVPLKIRTRVLLAEADRLEGHVEKALDQIKEGLKLARKHGLHFDEVLLLREAAMSHGTLQRFETVEQIYRDIAAFAHEREMPALEAEAQMTLGMVQTHSMGARDAESMGRRAERAIELCSEARKMAEALGDYHTEMLARICEGLGWNAKGRFEESRNLYRRVIEQARSLGDPATEADALTLLAAALLRLDRPEAAYEAFRQAEKFYERAQQAHSSAVAQVGRGVAAYRLCRDEEARSALQKGAARFDEQSHRLSSDRHLTSFEAVLPARVRSLLVEIHAREGNVEAAFIQAELARARALRQECGDRTSSP